MVMESFILSLDPWLIYVAVGLLAFGESVSFLSLVMPGEIALVGAAAVAPLVGVDPVLLGVVATGAAAAGGLAGYEIGRRYGRSLVSWEPLARRIEPHLPGISRRLASPAGPTVVITARFNQLTRALAPAVAGMTHMSWRRFAWANITGAVLWGATFTLVGVFAAQWWHSSSGLVQVILAAVLAAAAGAWFALGRSRRRETAPVQDRGRLVTDPERRSEEEGTPKSPAPWPIALISAWSRPPLGVPSPATPSHPRSRGGICWEWAHSDPGTWTRARAIRRGGRPGWSSDRS